MGGRKKGSQKAAAAEKTSKPTPVVRKAKASADKRASARPPIVPPGRGEITEPVPFDGMSATRISTVQEQPPHPPHLLHPGVVKIEGTGSVLQVETTVLKGPLNTGLDAIEDLCTQIGRTITAVLALPAPVGDNQAPERNAAVSDLEVFIRLGTLTVHVVRGQVQSADPDPVVVEQNLSAFQAVRAGASWFRERFLGGMVKGVGEIAARHYQPQIDALFSQLDRQISALSSRLPEVIALIEHWARLLAP